MKTVQIQCDQKNWDGSTLIVYGLSAVEGRQRLPRTIKPASLPAERLEQWHELVHALGQVDPGGWAAQHIAAELRDAEINEETGERNGPVVHLTIDRRWDDGTTAEPLEMDMSDNVALDFFGWLTRDEQAAN